MNLKRISAVFYKDAMWAMYNKKLLILVLMPPLLSVLFHFVGKGLLLGFSQVFTFAMIGSLLGSYLVTEEKRIESLKNVLITPLTPVELAAGKFLLPLTLCLIFSFLTFLIARKPMMFFNPSLIIGIILMSAIVSLFGLIMGLIAKNEQELGVFAPIFILIFMMGTIQGKTNGIAFSGYFPEFHLVHLIENYNVLSARQVSLHLVFLVAEFLVTLLVASTYLRFFFSSDADSKRINLRTVLSFIPFIVLMVVSGLSVKEFQVGSKDDPKGSMAHFKIEGEEVTVDVAFDPLEWDTQYLKSDVFRTLQMNSKKSIKEIFIVIGNLEHDEDTLDRRIKKFSEKEELFYFVVEPSTKEVPDFTRLVYTKRHQYKTAYELQCGKEVLRFHFENPLDGNEYQTYTKQVLELIKNSKVECKNKAS